MPSAAAIADLADAALAAAEIPGLAVAAVTATRTVCALGRGHANVERRLRATETTPFLAASASKLVVAATVMALCERQMLDLDRDVSDYLPFTLRHPAHRSTPITVRMLLGHTGSIEDDTARALGSYVPGDADGALSDWLVGHLGVGPTGEATGGFAADRPGTRRRYSNTGVAIAALAAERAAHLSFDDLARALVLRPLQMSRSSFRLSDFKRAKPATPYQGGLGTPLRPCAHYGYPDYPTGTLRTSAADLARFVRCLLAGGTLERARILSAESVRAMIPGPGEGVGFQISTRNGRTLVGHDGQDVGAAARVLLDVENQTGIVLLGNAAWLATPERARCLLPLQDALFEIAAQARRGRGGGDR